MTGSYDDAEDLVQETFLRAWRARDTYEGRARCPHLAVPHRHQRLPGLPAPYGPRPQALRAVARHEPRRGEPPARIEWLQPYPDDELPSAEERSRRPPLSRETLELVFLAAVQHLPPRQRAVLILRDVLGLTATETAGLLDMTVASVNSALQRARPTLRDHLPGRPPTGWAPRPTERQREVVKRYMDAAERLDLSAIAELLSEDVRLTMPPNPFWFTGRDALSSSSASLDPTPRCSSAIGDTCPPAPTGSPRPGVTSAARYDRLPRPDPRRAALRRRRPDRRDHLLRAAPVPGLRTPAENFRPVSDD
jgi:RNA polymerase sigma-70 factor (TIGR02960 family)